MHVNVKKISQPDRRFVLVTCEGASFALKFPETSSWENEAEHFLRPQDRPRLVLRGRRRRLRHHGLLQKAEQGAELRAVSSSADRIGKLQRFSSTLSQGFEDLGSSPTTVATYCTSRPWELPKSSSSKPCDRADEKRCKLNIRNPVLEGLFIVCLPFYSLEQLQ